MNREEAVQQAREIVTEIADHAIKLAIVRNMLVDEDKEELDEDEIVADAVACMVGDDTGCLEPDDPRCTELVDKVAAYAADRVRAELESLAKEMRRLGSWDNTDDALEIIRARLELLEGEK